MSTGLSNWFSPSVGSDLAQNGDWHSPAGRHGGAFRRRCMKLKRRKSSKQLSETEAGVPGGRCGWKALHLERQK